MKISDEIFLSINDIRNALTSHGLDFDFSPTSDTNINEPLKVGVDSRQVDKSSLFIALVGTHVDGHTFLETVSKKHCQVAIVEQKNDEIQLAQIVVRSTREAWSAVCRHFFGYPDLKLHLVGVTGTNGKTSCVWMIREILDQSGVKTASVGTLGYRIGIDSLETSHTTPDPPVLFSLMKNSVDSGAEAFAMEVSSHSIAQRKIFGLRFQSLAFTSFSQDHLDFHLTLDNYFETKLKLFRSFASQDCKFFITTQVLLYRDPDLPRQQLVGRGAKQFYPTAIRQTLGSPMSIDMNTPDGALSNIELPFFGEIFIDNFSCALAISQYIVKDRGLSLPSVLAKIKMKPVPGRMELVPCQKVGRPTVLVDYAHTPDALESTIKTTRQLSRGKLTTVFGCGGDRDKGKRPKMGRIASHLSDFAVVTDDNPRTETSESIIEDILSGIHSRDRAQVIPDRSLAIRQAVKGSRTGDVVLIAGKGHENYQIIGSTQKPFSDVETAYDALESKRVFLVLGAGISGMGACKILVSQGDEVLLLDDKPLSADALSQFVGIKAFSTGDFKLEKHCVDAVIKSPGVSPDHPVLIECKAAGLPIISEIDLSFDRCANPVIAVTGTNGKSTTTCMVAHILNTQKISSIACGNIGKPPSEVRAEQTVSRNTVFVCELSSYQLEDSHCLSPQIAIITSFSSDHLERHKSLENYFLAKWKIALTLPKNGLLILTSSVANFATTFGCEWPNCKTLIVEDQTQKTGPVSTQYVGLGFDSKNVYIDGQPFSAPILSKLCLADQLNAIMATIASRFVSNTTYEECFLSLENFVFLPYRNQNLGHLPNGSLVINDSKSTNMESTIFAVKSASGPIVLLMGGAGKGERYVGINQFDNKILRYILFGKSAKEIEKDIARTEKISLHSSFKGAVDEGFLLAQKQKVTLLLSPACASFDEFKNFEHRGRVFQDHFQKEKDYGKIN